MKICQNPQCTKSMIKKHPNARYCSDDCATLYREAKLIASSRAQFVSSPSNEFCECVICGFMAKNLQVHIQSKHCMKAEDYRKKYNTASMCFNSLKERSDNLSGSNNPGYQHGGTLSPWSEKSGRTNDQIADSKARAKENRYNQTQLQYWLNKGYTYDEAVKFRSNRQATFSLAICVSKHGLEKGTAIFNERQKKWLATLDAKPQDEKDRINRAKLSYGCNISLAENMLYQILIDKKYKVEQQFIIPNGKSYVYDLRCGNKIIEYNGDFWHMNPLIYDSNYINPVSKDIAHEKWLYDRAKNERAINDGYDVLVVWEHDYNKDRLATIQKCIDFLNS